MTSSPSGRRAGKSSLSAVASRRVERPAPLRQAVYDALLELIVSRTLAPGQHLVEAELAEYLGVSRQPVREALQRLQTDGWVDLRPAQGAFVHTPTEEEADQLLAVRSVLETYSAKLAAEHATTQDVKQLKRLQKAGEDALAAADAERLVQANANLHAAVAAIGRNKVLAEMIGLLDRRVRWYYTPIARPHSRDSWNEHAELIAAVADGDAERAGEVMRRHAEQTRQTYHNRKNIENN
ncbi:GntR family transcriptional regulator [Lentzea nigeriaca]|uniref:GntR family transcriptional regulator n=1 Tax=Lentzea nigeriaca TaxID=1128665 RepID=UPI00195C11B6|nr:GntR family transcriptional regulator [Lentzea nigeriaca]MBM7864898.1 DNA-binding GntR family transcriptional regulator [Lentzea nigeriaca]